MAERTAADVEAEIMQGYYGDLPWQDLPGEPGWYWFRVVPSRVIRGPTRVRWIRRKLVSPAGDQGGAEKPVRTFQRQWAGPLARPVEPPEDQQPP